MIVGNTLLLALRAIRRNLLRSALTMLGVVIGVAAVIASLALVAVGWAFAVAALGPRGLPAIVLAAVLWPAALWLASRSDPVETGAQVALAAAVGLACIALLAAVRSRAHAAPAVADAPEEVPVA